MSRGVGSVFIAYILNEAKKAGKKIFADFRKTDRNRQMYITYKFLGFTEMMNQNDFIVFEHSLTGIPSYPPYIKLQYHGKESEGRQ